MRSRITFTPHRGVGKLSFSFLAVCLIGLCFWEIPIIAAPMSLETVSESRVQANPQGPTEEPQYTLKLAEPLSRQIKGGETHIFAISLTSGQYVKVDIEQHGSILLATLLSPSGDEVVQMDSPAGGHGPIYLSAIASQSGTYRLEIRSTNKWANAQSYDVVLETLRNHEPNDLALMEAESAFAEGRKEFRADKAKEALKYYDLALPYWKASANHHWQALTEYARSEAYRSIDRQKAEGSLNETLRILGLEMAPNDWRIKASALNDLGPIYGAAGKNENAFGVLNEALSLFVANHDRRGEASALGNLARLHGRAGDLSRSRELIEKALALRRAENDKPGEINLLNSLGAIFDQLGEPDKALAYFTQALAGWESMDELRPSDHARVTAVLHNLATASDKLGNWDQARDYYDKALAKYKPENPARAATLDNKGELYASLGNTRKAKEFYDEALKILAPLENPDRDAKASLLVHIGQLSMQLGDDAAALAYFEEARRTEPNPPKMADVLSNLGAALAAQGKLEKAMEAYEGALDIQLKLRDRRGQALTLQNRGKAYDLMGRQADALIDFNRALVFWKQIKDKRGEAATLNGIALVEQKRGNLAEAFASSGEAIKIIESLRTYISNRQLRTSYFANRENYYELDIDLRMQMRKLADGDEFVVTALESSEKARARVLLDALSEAGLDRLEFNQLPNARLAGLREERLNLLGKLSARADARTKLLNDQHKPEQIAILDKEIDRITEKLDDLDARIRAQSPRFANLTRPQPSTLKQIQQQLDAETLLLEYSLGEKRGYLWVVSKDSIKGSDLPARNQIEEVARRVIEALTARNREDKNESWPQRQSRIAKADADYSVAAAELSTLIIDPIAAQLGQKRLVIVADGALQLVPFGALPAPLNAIVAQDAKLKSPAKDLRPAQGSRLIDRHEIISLPSASVLVLQRRELRNRQRAHFAVAVMADPVFDDQDDRVAKAKITDNHGKEIAGAGPGIGVAPSAGQGADSGRLSSTKSALASALRDVGISDDGKLQRLRFSRREAEAIVRAVPPGQSFSAKDFKASRQTATSGELAKFRIVHFATHGVLDLEHPELSGIVLSMVDEKGQPQNGYLRLPDIYNLNLPAELVVLSACQTGVGKQVKGEGLMALTRGFMYAGAKSVVASLWKVDDVATSELMTEFYRQMFVNKLKPAAALRAAQVKMSQQPRWKSPYYWSGFFLQGEWN